MVKTSKDTEQKIIEAAKKVFVKKGMGGARMQEIADEAGINKALLHYYFRNKQRLFEAIFKEVFRNFMPNLISSMNKEGSFKDKIAGIVNLYIEQFKDNVYLPIFIITEINHNPERLNVMATSASAITKTKFIKEFNDKVQTGEFIDIAPYHMMVNILSLTIFPILASPVIMKIFQLDESKKEAFWEERKQLVPEMIMQTLTLNNHEKAD